MQISLGPSRRRPGFQRTAKLPWRNDSSGVHPQTSAALKLATWSAGKGLAPAPEKLRREPAVPTTLPHARPEAGKRASIFPPPACPWACADTKLRCVPLLAGLANNMELRWGLERHCHLLRADRLNYAIISCYRTSITAEENQAPSH